MSQLLTSGFVGRVLGNRWLYPEVAAPSITGLFRADLTDSHISIYHWYDKLKGRHQDIVASLFF